MRIKISTLAIFVLIVLVLLIGYQLWDVKYGQDRKTHEANPAPDMAAQFSHYQGKYIEFNDIDDRARKRGIVETFIPGQLLVVRVMEKGSRHQETSLGEAKDDGSEATAAGKGQESGPEAMKTYYSWEELVHPEILHLDLSRFQSFRFTLIKEEKVNLQSGR